MKFRIYRTSGGVPPCDGAYPEVVTEIVRGLTIYDTIWEEEREHTYWFFDLEWQALEQFIAEHEMVLITHDQEDGFKLEIVDGDLE